MTRRVPLELAESVFMWLGHCLELAEFVNPLAESYDFQVPSEPKQLENLRS